jgi:predicted Zn finger-like uncharacterized protein
VQRQVSGRDGHRMDRSGPRPCPNCGAPLRVSHREYAGGGASTVMLRCAACGHTLRGATRSDADRQPGIRGRSRRHQPVDEGPPSNPVLDADVARRLLEEMGG